MFEDFPISRYLFSLRAKSDILLPPFKGSTFRGGFGHAFKRLICTFRNKDCSECLLQKQCIYSYIFETPHPEDTEALKNYTSIPHPFVIEPPINSKTHYVPDEEITFNLLLIGKAIDYLPYFIYAFTELGKIGIGKKRGKFTVEEVRCLSYTPNSQKALCNKTLYTSQNQILTGTCHKFQLMFPKDNTSTLSLKFLTPTRIKFNASLVSKLEFHKLIRVLLRRISNISNFHCKKKLDVDFKGLIERAESITVKHNNLTWYDWERYSSRQDRKMKLGGLVGEITFEGNIGEFMPFIKLGEILHIGKGTSFGLGKYETI